MPTQAELLLLQTWRDARDRVRALDRLQEQKAEAEQDFLAFVRLMWPVLEPEKPLIEGWCLDLLADVMMAVTDGELTRVCINVPPGSTKSTLLNVLLPAWHWGPCALPHQRYLSISYSTSVPIRDNLRFAQLVKSQIYRTCWGDKFKLERDGAIRSGECRFFPPHPVKYQYESDIVEESQHPHVRTTHHCWQYVPMDADVEDDA